MLEYQKFVKGTEDEYKRKIPKNLLQLFKLERKFGYEPELDFNRPLNDCV